MAVPAAERDERAVEAVVPGAVFIHVPQTVLIPADCKEQKQSVRRGDAMGRDDQRGRREEREQRERKSEEKQHVGFQRPCYKINFLYLCLSFSDMLFYVLSHVFKARHFFTVDVQLATLFCLQEKNKYLI